MSDSEREELAKLLVVEENPWQKPESCRTCPLFLEPGIVRGVGPLDAKAILVGEAPGADETASLSSQSPQIAATRVDGPSWLSAQQARFAPFVGGSGRLLSSLCAQAGLYRKGSFVTNVVKCRPPGNRTPTPTEIVCCAPFLIEEIEARSANVLVALGEVALNVLADKKGIGLHRGVPIEGFGGRKVLATWHPAFIARAQYYWPFAVADLVRAQAESSFPELRRVQFEIVTASNSPDSRADLLRAIRKRGAFTFDFETTGLSGKRDQIKMCGFTEGPDKAHVLDWSASTHQLLQTLFDDPSVEIVGQNILNFDFPFAEDQGLKIRWENVFDTMTAFHLANSSYGQTTVAEQNAGTFRQRGADKDLTFISSLHTDIPYWKSKEAYGSRLYEVCGTDCIATDRAALDPQRGLKRELESYSMTKLYYEHVLPVHPILRKMTKLGVKLHEERAAGWALMLAQEADKMEVSLKEKLGEPYLNLDSPQQLMKVLYEKLKLPVQYVMDKKRGMRPTANADALEALAELAPENKVLQTLVTIRHFRKLKSTYIEPAFASGDGRIHPSFGVSKAATGRFNSWRPNAQNVPEEVRDIWIPDSEEHVLMSVDWSQIEWRLAMVMSGDPVGLALLASGVDNHRAVASETLGKRLEDVTDEERYASKFIVYGLGYGRGAASISEGHNLPMDFVQQFIARFLSRFAVFTKWRERNVDFVKKNHFLANPFMRRRWWYTHQVTEVYNFPQQSTAADMMYEALIELERQIPSQSTLRLTVHDEAVLNVPKDIVRETWTCVRDVMQMKWPQIVEASADPAIVRKFYPEGWFCPADIGIGTDWMMTKSKDAGKKEAAKLLRKELGCENL
jgi:uracil-DNA glycosylase family 4